MPNRVNPIIIYLPFGGGGIKYVRNREAQVNSWVKEVFSPSEVIHICGDENLSLPKLNQGILTLPLSEIFENGLERQLLALNWVIKNRDFDWICFSNTSNYFDHKMLQEFLRSNHTFKVAATIGQWNDGEESIQFPSGAGTLIDYETCLLLSNFDPSPFKALPNDVAIGKILSILRVPIYPLRRVNITDWENYKDFFHYRVKHWHFSSITTFRMKLIWKIKSSSGMEKTLLIVSLNLSQAIFKKLSQIRNFLRLVPIKSQNGK